MGVLPCDREGCRNIMCEYYSQRQRWYLCQSCFEELVKLGPETNLIAFMGNNIIPVDEEASRAYFETIFDKRS